MKERASETERERESVGSRKEKVVTLSLLSLSLSLPILQWRHRQRRQRRKAKTRRPFPSPAFPSTANPAITAVGQRGQEKTFCGFFSRGFLGEGLFLGVDGIVFLLSLLWCEENNKRWERTERTGLADDTFKAKRGQIPIPAGSFPPSVSPTTAKRCARKCMRISHARVPQPTPTLLHSELLWKKSHCKTDGLLE